MLNIFKYKRGRSYMTGPKKERPYGFTRNMGQTHAKRPKWKRRRKKNQAVIKRRIDAKRFKREVTRRRKRKRLNHAYNMRALFGSAWAEHTLPQGR